MGHFPFQERAFTEDKSLKNEEKHTPIFQKITHWKNFAFYTLTNLHTNIFTHLK